MWHWNVFFVLHPSFIWFFLTLLQKTYFCSNVTMISHEGFSVLSFQAGMSPLRLQQVEAGIPTHRATAELQRVFRKSFPEPPLHNCRLTPRDPSLSIRAQISEVLGGQARHRKGGLRATALLPAVSVRAFGCLWLHRVARKICFLLLSDPCGYWCFRRKLMLVSAGTHWYSPVHMLIMWRVGFSLQSFTFIFMSNAPLLPFGFYCSSSALFSEIQLICGLAWRRASILSVLTRECWSINSNYLLE